MNNLEKISERLTVWVGTPVSILVHTLLFVGIFVLKLVGVSMDQILLILTTAVSLEAIYLAIFIQMSVNKANLSIDEVEKDIDDIQEDIDDIQEDISDDDEDDDEIIKTVKEIEKKMAKLYREIVNIKKKKTSKKLDKTKS